MTMTLSLLLPQELGFALLGTISTVPIIWLLTTTVYSWAISTATAIEITGSGSVSRSSNGDDHEDDVIITIDGNEEEGMECAAAGQEDDALALELERPKPTSIQNVNYQIVHNEADNGVESEDDNELEHNPMGLQTWPNGMISRENCCDDLFAIASLLLIHFPCFPIFMPCTPTIRANKY